MIPSPSPRCRQRLPQRAARQSTRSSEALDASGTTLRDSDALSLWQNRLSAAVRHEQAHFPNPCDSRYRECDVVRGVPIAGECGFGRAHARARCRRGRRCDERGQHRLSSRAVQHAGNVSSSAFEASGHGWWVNLNCPAGTLARVTVVLQELYSDGSWRVKGVPGVATVRSGGGSGARATGRAPCTNATLTGWRSVVDVDLIGIPDDPLVTITPPINVSCRVL